MAIQEFVEIGSVAATDLGSSSDIALDPLEYTDDTPTLELCYPIAKPVHLFLPIHLSSRSPTLHTTHPNIKMGIET